MAARQDPPKPDTIYVLATLQKRPPIAPATDERYGFVIRWILGASQNAEEQENTLPRDGDVFKVAIRRASGGGFYLQPGENSWAAGKHSFEIKPLPFAMLDPPRQPAQIPEYPGAAGKTWLVGVEPKGPVEDIPADGDLKDGDGTKPIGVKHLIQETDTARVAWRVREQFRSAMRAQRLTLARAGVGADEEVEAAARDLALFAMHGVKRIAALPRRVRSDIENLERRTLSRAEGAGADDVLFGGRTVAENWRRSALFAAALADRETVARADELRSDAARMRSQLRMRALQGGKMIDFWGGLTGNVPAVPVEDRGKVYPASHLLGLGCQLGNFTKAEVQSWATLPQRTSELIAIEVTHVPSAEARTAPADMAGADFLPEARSVATFKPGTAMLFPSEIQAAISGGSSRPPGKPRRAFVNYDLVRTWVDVSKLPQNFDIDRDGPGLSHATGDAKIEVLILPPKVTYDATGRPENTVIGFNVYGVWEGASAASDKWFKGEAEPSLKDLKPWLITRRYSYVRDLKGALPAGAGGVHPAIVGALADPPWHPTLLRSSALEDKTPEAEGETATPLPDVTNVDENGERLTSWSFDLRKGMRAGKGAPAGLNVGWDPAYPAAVDWTPEMWRQDDPAVPPEHARPQGYRFWVTSVDGVEQESDPVPVETLDRATSPAVTPETYLFTPQFRTQLPPVPQGPAGSGDELLIDLPSPSRLVVSFKTPRIFLLGGSETPDSPPPKIDVTRLEAHVLLLRRRLLRKVVGNEGPRPTARAGEAILSTAPWREMLKRERQEGGWEVSSHALRALTLPQGRTAWSAPFTLNSADRGFEYKALVGFSVASRYQPFWAKDVAARPVQVPVRDSSGFKLTRTTVAESPRVSNVVATSVLPSPNIAPARPAGLPQTEGDTRIAAAVLPPPNIDRDLVLLRLLANPNEDGADRAVFEELKPWLDIDEAITLGQAMMCARALDRVNYKNGAPPTAEEIAVVREILTKDFVNLKGADWQTLLKQHATVGFRGLEELRWSYDPFAKTPPTGTDTDTEAEAVGFRIFTARAPRNRLFPASTPVRMEIEWANGVFQVTSVTIDVPKTPTGEATPEGKATISSTIAALKSGAQPALVRLDNESTVLFANAFRFTGAAEEQIDRAEMKLLGGTAAAGVTYKADICLGIPIADLQHNRFDAKVDHRVFVPVGGGQAEAIVWWVVAVSAQQEIAPAEGRPVTFRLFPATVKALRPVAPMIRSVRSSSGPFDAALDPTKPAEKAWSPTKLTKASALFDPRLYVAWDQDYVDEDSTLIEIDRHFQAASTGNEGRRTSRRVSGEWEAIRSIEALADDAPIRAEWVEAVGRNWLRGRIVEEDGVPAEAKPFVNAKERPLPGKTGVKLLGDPSAGEQRKFATLIDYFSRNENKIEVMTDGDYEYAYRMRYSLLVDANAPEEWRRLESDWSPWSQHVIAHRPPLQVKAGTRTSADSDPMRPPSVTLRFQAAPPSTASTRNAWRQDMSRAEYRIMVQRKVRSAFVETTDDPSDRRVAWYEIGKPLTLPYRPDGAPAEIELLDQGFERDDPDTAMTVTYRVQVVQYVVDEQALSERLIRKQGDDATIVPVEIPKIKATRSGDATVFSEHSVTQLINVW